MTLETKSYPNGKVEVTICADTPAEGIRIGIMQANLGRLKVDLMETTCPKPGIILTVKGGK